MRQCVQRLLVQSELQEAEVDQLLAANDLMQSALQRFNALVSLGVSDFGRTDAGAIHEPNLPH